jgi:hypothetical protein
MVSVYIHASIFVVVLPMLAFHALIQLMELQITHTLEFRMMGGLSRWVTAVGL